MTSRCLNHRPCWVAGQEQIQKGHSGGDPVTHNRRDKIPGFQDTAQQSKCNVQLTRMNSYRLALKQKMKHADLGVLTAHFLQKW